MITPRFSLEQNENQLIVTIHAPYTKIKDTEIHVNDNDFRFFSSPYYLRLTLPGNVEETENSSAKYYVESNSFIVTLDKVIPGEHFEKLEMLTSLLQPHASKKVAAKKPLIEVLSSSRNEEVDVDDSDDDESSEFDEEEWSCEQKMEEEAADTLLQQHKYGFANNHSGLGNKYEVELGEVAQIRNPDNLSASERKHLRLEAENSQFSDDHYLSDLIENDEISNILQSKINYKKLKDLTGSEREQLKNFKNREFLLDKMWQKRLQLGLFDLIYAYTFDLKITGGSHCVESSWNISRLSCTLSWFDIFDSVEELVKSCVRRSLAFPLYRHWRLSKNVLNDTISIFKLGTPSLLKCLLEIHRLFSKRDPYYLLNQLYIEDYCVWIQTKSISDFDTMLEAIRKAVDGISKGDVGFDLVELEAAAVAVEDEQMEEDISSQITSVTI